MVDEGHITEDEAALHNAVPTPHRAHAVHPATRRLLRRGGQAGTARRPAPRRDRRRTATTPCSGAACTSTPRSTRHPATRRGRPRPDPRAVRAGGPDGAVPGRPEPWPAARMPSAPSPPRRSTPAPGRCGRIIGGPGFGDDYKFNLATQGYRQPGLVVQDLRARRAARAGLLAPGHHLGPRTVPVQHPAASRSPTRSRTSGTRRGGTGSITSMTTSVVELRLRPPRADRRHRQRRRAGRGAGHRHPQRRNEIVAARPRHLLHAARHAGGHRRSAWRPAYAAIANDGYYHRPYFVRAGRSTATATSSSSTATRASG